MIQLLGTVIDERTTPDELERIRRNMSDAIRELQLGVLPRAIIKGIELPNGAPITITHKLGRSPIVFVSPPRNAVTTGGSIIEVGGQPREQFVVLQADGWGATITVDLVVF